MAATQEASQSILGTLAAHEKKLLAQVEEAGTQAHEIVERARSDARQYLQTEEDKLAAEVAQSRVEAQAARENTFQQTVEAAEAQLVGVREEARRRVDDTAKSVLELFLPNTGTGAAS